MKHAMHAALVMTLGACVGIADGLTDGGANTAGGGGGTSNTAGGGGAANTGGGGGTANTSGGGTANTGGGGTANTGGGGAANTGGGGTANTGGGATGGGSGTFNVPPDSFYFGWNVHLASYFKQGFLPPVFSKLQQLGANSLRGGLEWSWMQYRDKTSFAFDPSMQAETDIVNQTNATAGNEIAFLDVLGFHNQLFWDQPTQDITANPTAAGSVFDVYASGFADYAAYEMSKRPNQAFYEIHNEWNLGFHIDSTTPNYATVLAGDTYARLFTRVAPRVRSLDANAKILTVGIADCKNGTPATLPWGACYPWLIDQLEYINSIQGSLANVDGVAIHTYADTNTTAMPERLYNGLITARAWLLERSPAYAQSPRDFYITEAGFPQVTAGNGTLTEQEQSNNLQRMFFLYRTLPYVKGIWVYDFIDDPIVGREGSFGVLKNNQSEKVGYGQLAALAQLIRKGTHWQLVHGDTRTTPWAERMTNQWINYFPKQFFAVQATYADPVLRANRRVTIVWSPTTQELPVTVKSNQPLSLTRDFAVTATPLTSGSVINVTARPAFIFQDEGATLTLE